MRKGGRRASRVKRVTRKVMGVVKQRGKAARRVWVGHGQWPAQLGALGGQVGGQPGKILCKEGARARG